jgi:hypothetical protein
MTQRLLFAIVFVSELAIAQTPVEHLTALPPRLVYNAMLPGESRTLPLVVRNEGTAGSGGVHCVGSSRIKVVPEAIELLPEGTATVMVTIAAPTVVGAADLPETGFVRCGSAEVMVTGSVLADRGPLAQARMPGSPWAYPDIEGRDIEGRCKKNFRFVAWNMGRFACLNSPALRDALAFVVNQGRAAVECSALDYCALDYRAIRERRSLSSVTDAKTKTRRFAFSQPVWGTSETDLWVGTRHYDGRFWTLFSELPERVETTGLFGSGPEDVWMAAGTLSHFDGTSIKRVEADIPYWINDVWGSGANDVWVVGRHGHIHHFDGKSLKPVRVPAQVAPDLRGVWGSGPKDAWAVGDQMTILHFNGATWEPTPLSKDGSLKLNDVWGSGANDVWAVGARGTVLHFDGRSWQSDQVPIAKDERDGDRPDFLGVWAGSPRDVWVVGGENSILHRDGTKWSSWSARCPHNQPRAVTGVGKTQIWITGTQLCQVKR